MNHAKIAIIGAGMARLSCARALVDAGLQTILFDKGRGIGGRLATRRAADGLQFDHGAQYLTAKTPAFAAVLDRMQAAGAAAPWNDGSDRDHVVGLPGMSGIAKHLGQGLDVRQNAELVGLKRQQGAWLLRIAETDFRFDHVVLTLPAPQALRLLGSEHAFAPALSVVEMAPCLTLMAAFAPSTPVPFLTRRNDEGPLSWIACDGSKPGRNGQGAWVAQAGMEWSRQNLERDMTDIANPAACTVPISRCRSRSGNAQCCASLALCPGDCIPWHAIPERHNGHAFCRRRLVYGGASRGRLDQRQSHRRRSPPTDLIKPPALLEPKPHSQQSFESP